MTARLESGQSSDVAPELQVAMLVLTILLISAALFRGGLPPLALMFLEVQGLLLIGLVLWRRSSRQIDLFEWTLLILLLAIPLVYLIPLPHWIPGVFQGRDPYIGALAMLGEDVRSGFHAVSIVPLLTESAWLVLFLPVGVYLATRALDENQVQRLVYILFAVVAFQAILAAFQFAAARSGIAYPFVELFDRHGPSGTFANRNHLAGLMEMTFPLALALFVHDFGHRRHHRRSSRWQKRLLDLIQGGGRPSGLFGLLAVLFIFAVIVTKSRTGLVLTMLGIIVAAVVFSSRLGGKRSFGLIGQLGTLVVAAAVVLGLAPVLDRFSMDVMSADARWPLAVATFDAAGSLLPFGSGPGTYPDVFPVFQPLELGQWFVNRAHNDYLEALFEIGVSAVVLLALFLILALRQWRRLVTSDEWPRFRFLQIGAGIGMILLMLHSMFDYNLHTPANLAYFAFLCAIFFAAPTRAPLHLDHRKHRRRRKVPMQEIGLGTAPKGADLGQPIEPKAPFRNPFMD